MASVSTGKKGGGLNVELNLVPFIDLLSSLVLFLLVTAVWLQVGTIPASVESQGKARFSTTEQNRLTVHLTMNGIQLSWPPNLATRMPKVIMNVKGSYDLEKLDKVLGLLSKEKSFPLGAVSSDDNVEYGNVISAVDSLKRAGFTAVALSTN